MTEETSPPLEVEIKLTGGKAALRQAEAALKRRAGKVEWKTDALVSSYYDTVDRRLSQRGVSYRVRKKNSSYLQTVKAASVGKGAAAARPEWEVPLRGARPALDQLPDEARSRMGLVLPGELRKLFSVDVERKKTIVTITSAGGASATLEVAIDRGDVIAGRKRDPLNELEIELVSGSASVIYDLAGTLAEVGLSVSRITKAARGFALLDGTPPAVPQRAPKLALGAGDTTSEALARIFESGLANVLQNEEPSRDGTDPEGVHQMRVSLRRMRSVLTVFKSIVPASNVAWAKEELRWLAGEMGPARDWDVFAGEILAPVQGPGIDVDGLKALVKGADKRRADGYKRVREALASPRYAKFLLGMSHLVETHGWMPANAKADHPLNRPLSDVAGGILDGAYKKVRKKGKDLAKLDIPARHEVRIELKKFRYTVDFLQGIFPVAAVSPFTSALSSMQDKFGHLNDVAVAEQLLGELVNEKGLPVAERRLRGGSAGQVIGWYARGVHDEEAAFIADWKALMAAPPFWTKSGGNK
jgi:triphosphatase